MNKIKNLEQEIQAKKQELKELKKSSKTPFAKTKFGNVCLSFLSTISKPGAKLHQYAESKKKVEVEKSFFKLLEECKKSLNDAEESEAPNNVLANTIAHRVMELENHSEFHKYCEPIANSMHYEIKRLRESPPNQELFNHISNLVDQEVEAQRNKVDNNTILDSL